MSDDRTKPFVGALPRVVIRAPARFSDIKQHGTGSIGAQEFFFYAEQSYAGLVPFVRTPSLGRDMALSVEDLRRIAEGLTILADSIEREHASLTEEKP